MGWWTDLWGDDYTDQVMDQNPGMSFYDAKRLGDQWEASGHRSYQDFMYSRGQGGSRGGRDRNYDTGYDSYYNDRGRDSYYNDRGRDSYYDDRDRGRDRGRDRRQRDPDPYYNQGGYDYKSPEGTTLGGYLTWPGGNANLTQYGFSKSQSDSITKYYPNITQQEAANLARAVQDIVNSGNVQEDSPWWKFWRGDERHQQDAAIKSILESGQPFEQVAAAYRDAGRPISYEEAINLSDENSTGALESEARRTALERSTELYEQAKKDKKKLDRRAEELYESSKEERERRLELEDDSLKMARQAQRALDEERIEALENYRKARGQYEDDRMSRTSLMNEIRNAPSTYEEAQRQGHEQSLKNSAALTSVLPTRAGGSAVRSILDRQKELDLNVASSSSVGRLQEIEGRRSLLGNLLGQQQEGAQRQQQLDQQSSLQSTQAGVLGLQFAQHPFNVSKSAGSASRNDLASGIQQRQLGLDAVGLSGNFGSQSLGTNLNFNKFFSSEEQKEYERQLAEEQRQQSTLSSLLGGAAKFFGFGF